MTLGINELAGIILSLAVMITCVCFFLYNIEKRLTELLILSRKSHKKEEQNNHADSR